jgi:signal peptidase I
VRAGRIRAAARGARTILGWLAVLVVAAAWAATLRPAALGGPATYLVVRGSSMLPTFETGDLIVLRAVPPYGIGDVVAYHVPAGEIGAGELVLHRIVAVEGERFVLQGDNNSAVDPWTPAAGDIAGRVWLALPGVGRAVAWLHQPITAAALAASIVVGLVLAGGARREPTTAPAAGP